MTALDIAFRVAATIWLFCAAVAISEPPSMGLPIWVRLVIAIGMALLIAIKVWKA